MRKADIVSAGVAVVFGLLLLFVVIPIWVPGHEESGYGLDARVMPIITATIFTVLAAGFAVSRLFLGRKVGAAVDSPAPISRANWRFLLLTALFLTAMLALFEFAGFLVAAPLTVAGFMLGMGERRPVPVILTSVLAAGVIWLFFWQLLKFPLP